MLSIFKRFKKETEVDKKEEVEVKVDNEKRAMRTGELGEYKIDIQLSQLPKEFKYLSDIIVENPMATSGYSQIDHIVLTPFGIFVVETKNYQGTIYGDKNRKTWLINGKFKMGNPLIQNYGHIQALKRYIDKKFHNYFISIVSFTKRCSLRIDLNLRDIHSNEIVIYDLYFSETIHRKINILKLQNKIPLINEKELEDIYKALTNANITDPKVRETHIHSLKEKHHNRQESTEPLKCAICNRPVSEKVANYCLSNNKFNGKIYCYEHQQK